MTTTIIVAVLVAALPVTPGRQVSAVERANDQFKAGMNALANERYETAEIAFKNAIELDPLHDGAFYGLGQVYMATKRYPDAVKAYEGSRSAFVAAIAAEKTDAAGTDRRIRDQLQAQKEYRRTLQQRSTTNSPGLAAAIQRADETIRQLETRLSRSTGGTPQVPAGLSMALGSAHFRSQNLEAAEREYLEAIAVEPNFGEAHNNLAVVYLMTGRLDQAAREIALAERAGFKVNPKLKEDVARRK